MLSWTGPQPACTPFAERSGARLRDAVLHLVGGSHERVGFLGFPASPVFPGMVIHFELMARITGPDAEAILAAALGGILPAIDREVHLHRADPRSVLVELSSEGDLIVVAWRQFAGRRVLRKARCPVVFVPPPVLPKLSKRRLRKELRDLLDLEAV